MPRPLGELFIGEHVTAESGERSGETLLLASADLTTHGVIVGMTGSGKTGLGVVLMEEALLAGVPVLAIDPKGDLGNLALTFPGLTSSEFEPWIDVGSARIQQLSVAELAARTAQTWSDGLASWGLGGDDVARLQRAARPVIYTPGSTAGIPLDVLGRLSCPRSADPSVRQDEADSIVSGLLALVGIQSDPFSGREHILLANLVTRAWQEGCELDLTTLLGQILDPPIRKLGVLDLETFFPASDRQVLVLRLNALLASPRFAAWAQGEALDIDSMLWDGDGRPRAAIVSLAHLEESERQFAVTLLLSRVISWMRSQPGTSELRALVYIDEVLGFAPPVANPPPKKPILTLLKQARAFGVGLVLSTQNPVDLDYRAVGNAGTWMIGRLQTAQDKDRLVDGLRAADGGVDVAEVERVIGRLKPRQFVLRTNRSNDLLLFSVRWAMSYLAGPLTGDRVAALMADRRAMAGKAVTPSADGSATSHPQPAAPSVHPMADDESPVPPSLPGNLPVRHVHPSAPWAASVGSVSNSFRLEPMLAARVRLLFDDTAADLRHIEEWEALIPLSGDRIDPALATVLDYDERDFSRDAPPGARYVSPSVVLNGTVLRSTRAALRDRLLTTHSLRLLVNRELKLWSRPGESEKEFGLRCRRAADEAEDAEAARIRATLESRRSRVEGALARAEDRHREIETQHAGRRDQELVDLGSSLLVGLLGGRGRARSLAGAARRAAGARHRTQSTDARLGSARNRIAEHLDELEDLEHQLQDALIEIDDEWSAKAEAITPIEVPLEKSDITVTDLFLVWVPVAPR